MTLYIRVYTVSRLWCPPILYTHGRVHCIRTVEPHWRTVRKRSKSVSKCNKVQQIRDFTPFERPWLQNMEHKKFGGPWRREAMFKYSLRARLRKPNTLLMCRYAQPILRNIPIILPCVYSNVRCRIHLALGSKPFNPIYSTLRTRLAQDPTASSFGYTPYAVYMC